MKINLPNNMSLDLTDDQVEELRKQLEKPEMPTTWEGAFDRMPKQKYIVNQYSEFEKVEYFNGSASRNCVPSEKQAKSVLAYTQLLVIVSALNGSVKMPRYDVYEVYRHGDHYRSCKKDHVLIQSPFLLVSDEAAQHLITHFSDLLNDFYMI